MDKKSSIHKIDFSILDALRGLASLYVCIAHCRGVLWVGINQYLVLHPLKTWKVYDYSIAIAASLTKLSGEAVIFFFVLSGFSIAYSLSREPALKNFFLKRFIRLYPPYILGVGIALLSLMLLRTDMNLYFSGKYHTLVFDTFKSSLLLFDPNNILKILFYYPTPRSILSPYWSLVYEVIFYLSAPFLLKRLNGYYLLSVCCFLAGLMMDISGINYYNFIAVNYIFHYNFYFAIGVYCYKNFNKLSSVPLLNNKNWTLILLLLYILMIFIESVAEKAFKLPNVMAAIACIIFIINLLNHSIKLHFLSFIGKFSYTLYVVHFSVLTCLAWVIFSVLGVKPPFIESFIFWIIAVFLCLIVSYGLYFLAERPSKILLQRLRKGNFLFLASTRKTDKI